MVHINLLLRWKLLTVGPWWTAYGLTANIVSVGDYLARLSVLHLRAKRYFLPPGMIDRMYSSPYNLSHWSSSRKTRSDVSDTSCMFRCVCGHVTDGANQWGCEPTSPRQQDGGGNVSKHSDCGKLKDAHLPFKFNEHAPCAGGRFSLVSSTTKGPLFAWDLVDFLMKTCCRKPVGASYFNV